MSNPSPPVKQSTEVCANKLTLQELFDSEETKLLRYAFALTGRRAVSEEIVQEVFLLLHTHFAEVDVPLAWLMRTVRNKAYNYIRDNKREVLDRDDYRPPFQACEDETPQQLLLHMETIGVLRQLMEQLDETDQQLLKLKYFEDRKYSEISVETGLSIGNVGYRLHHILKGLAEKLRPLGIDGMS